MKNINIIKDFCNAMQDYKTEIPFSAREATLICIQQDGSYFAAKSWKGKRALIENKEKTDTFLIAWHGHYSTDIFPVTQKELDCRLKSGE